ncbi:MAG: UDP-4-amino-4-deoxy-L-arabinose--oxoglutarate aminotransferase [Actinomycetia bacterium]|nr:UDP-4-amino-4-deoxy-L-arabinose--oxoglutarate aminotransferase [Actinomycetes bacterium]
MASTRTRGILPFAPPNITDDDIDEVVAALRSGWITTGPRTRLFEQKFAELVSVPSALAVNSCTAALHVALSALNIGEGVDVITTPMTFCSTVHVIEQVGARPILVDVDRATLNVDPDLVARQVESRKRGDRRIAALMPVHYAGQPCELDPLLDIAAAHDLAVIEDSAHALPAWYRDHIVGDVSHPSVRRAVAFSFYATKNLTTGEGGMLVAAPDVLEAARVWSLHGMSRDAWRRYDVERQYEADEDAAWRYDVGLPGFKYNMSDLQAALGLSQLPRLSSVHQRRREIARQYVDAFEDVESLEVPFVRSDVSHAWHLFALRLNLETLRIDRAEFIAHLLERGIAASVHFIPIHVLSYYRDRYGYAPDDLPVAWREYQRLVSLPIYPQLHDDDVEDVINAVLDVVACNRR